MSVFPRKRLSCSESSFIESDSSPPSGTRRRFSALIDTHRLASPLEVDPELPFPFKQPPVKARGTSLEGAMCSGPSQGDLRSFLTATGHLTKDFFSNQIIQQLTNHEFSSVTFFYFFFLTDKHLRPADTLFPLPCSPTVLSLPDPQVHRGATTDLVLRRVRHQQLSAEGEKKNSRPGTKVIKSASATALSVIIPAGNLTVKSYRTKNKHKTLISKVQSSVLNSS